MKLQLSLLLFFIWVGAYCQDCNVNFVASNTVFKSQKVKKISIHEVNKQSKQKSILFEYYLHQNGFPYKMVLFQQGNSTQPSSQIECNCSKDSLTQANSLYLVDKKGDKRLFTRKEINYNSKKQVIQQSIESFEGNYYRHISRYNPKSRNEYDLEVIAFENNDSARHSTSIKRKDYEESITREKKKGIWEVKKQVAKYNKGKLVTYEEYLNGKQILLKKGNNNETNPEKDGYSENNNELPFSEKLNYSDTVIVNKKSLERYSPILPNNKIGDEEFCKIIQYNPSQKEEVFEEDYYYQNKLIFIADVFGLESYRHFEYEFYR